MNMYLKLRRKLGGVSNQVVKDPFRLSLLSSQQASEQQHSPQLHDLIYKRGVVVWLFFLSGCGAALKRVRGSGLKSEKGSGLDRRCVPLLRLAIMEQRMRKSQ